GARIFVEVGPKKALQGFAEDVLGDRNDIVAVFTNHPKVGDIVAFNQALCGLYAAGLGRGTAGAVGETAASLSASLSTQENLGLVSGYRVRDTASTPTAIGRSEVGSSAAGSSATGSSAAPANANGDRYHGDRYHELGHLFAEVLERGYELCHGSSEVSSDAPAVITGAALGLPGTERIFDDGNIARILRGDQFIDLIPSRFRQAMLDKHITRLVKSEAGEARFETSTSVSDVIRLAGRGGAFDLENEFGVSADRVGALDRVTQLAIAVGIDALRDAGIPLVMRYKTTTKGTQLTDRWG